MGWMPTAVDLSAWNSFWTLERIQASGYRPTLRETLTEFNAGFAISVVLAMGFLTMGALLLHRTTRRPPGRSAAFASGIVSLYGRAMGTWSTPIMGAAAFSAMFSTCITVLDGYARSLDRAWAVATQTDRKPSASPRSRWFWSPSADSRLCSRSKASSKPWSIWPPPCRFWWPR